jgi:hypothetical protein
MVYKLRKYLYGLKQAPRDWYDRLDRYLPNLELIKDTADSNLYFKINQNSVLIVELFVDDIIFGGNDKLYK